MLVLLKRNQISEKKLIFSDLESRIVVMDLMFSSGKTVRLVAIYAPTTTGQSEYLHDLEKFLGTSYSLVFAWRV